MLCKKKNNLIEGTPTYYKRARLHLAGKNNKIVFGKDCNLVNCKIKLYGNSTLILSDNCYFENTTIVLRDSEARFGANTEACNVTVTSSGNSLLDLGAGSVICGEFDMRNQGIIRAKRLWTTWGPHIAANHGLIEFEDGGTADSIIYNSDFHPMYDLEGNQINENEDVHIGNNVWIGRKCFIFKGAKLGDGCIIASGTYTGKEIPPHSLVAGNPGRIVRRDVVWAVQKKPENEAMFPLTDEEGIKEFFARAYEVNPTIKHKKGCRLLTKISLFLSLLNAK